MSLAWFLPLPGSYAGVDVVGVYNFACSLREVLAKHPFLPHGCGLFSGSYFPSFSEGLSLRAFWHAVKMSNATYFPSFSEGLSLRASLAEQQGTGSRKFPFLFGGTFIEGVRSALPSRALSDFPSFSEGLSLRGDVSVSSRDHRNGFPFLFGGTFIEGSQAHENSSRELMISLPFRRDFH